jgi:hypothetical protein
MKSVPVIFFAARRAFSPILLASPFYTRAPVSCRSIFTVPLALLESVEENRVIAFRTEIISDSFVVEIFL